MELDEMKALWAQSSRKLEASMRLNVLLLQQWNLRKADTSLRRLQRGIAIEVGANVVVIVLLGLFVSRHFGESQFVIPAVALYLYTIGLVIANARQLTQIASVDYDEPVVTIQKKLEALRVARIRTTLWTVLFAPLMWLPMFIVGMLVLFGVDVYAIANPAWLAANVLFGLAVIPLAIFVARRYGARLNRSTMMRRLADAVAGRSLSEALASLDSIRRFEES